MSSDRIIEALKSTRSTLEAKGVQHLALFGSYARGEATPESDLDVLLDIDPARSGFSLVDLAAIQNLLTDITGIETSAVERKMIEKYPDFAKRIANDIVEVF